MLEGLGGTVDGSFFKEAAWVDVTKPPGYTAQRASLNQWWWPYVSGSYVVFSPNLIWLVITVLIWYIAPYRFDEAAQGFQWGWVTERILVSIIVPFSYTSFWHVSLYAMNWGKRPFNRNRKYRVRKVIHNMFYSLLGCLQWALWECIFIHCYASGKIPYSHVSLESTTGILKLLAWCFAVPLYRDIHFYFAHRFLHFRMLYKYVHSVHHRNTDVEPFSGLCMHPIEHLYYFTSVAPSIYCLAPPFALFWNGMHLLLSPGAAHSGYEDHFQGDQYHYLHHRYVQYIRICIYTLHSELSLFFLI